MSDNLFNAIQQNDTNYIQNIIEDGQDIYKEENGESPVTLSIKNNNKDVFSLLIKSVHFDINKRVYNNTKNIVELINSKEFLILIDPFYNKMNNELLKSYYQIRFKLLKM